MLNFSVGLMMKKKLSALTIGLTTLLRNQNTTRVYNLSFAGTSTIRCLVRTGSLKTVSIIDHCIGNNISLSKKKHTGNSISAS
jgi:hypothetical protein